METIAGKDDKSSDIIKNILCYLSRVYTSEKPMS